jgi:hypothetical protein
LSNVKSDTFANDVDPVGVINSSDHLPRADLWHPLFGKDGEPSKEFFQVMIDNDHSHDGIPLSNLWLITFTILNKALEKAKACLGSEADIQRIWPGGPLSG